MDIYNLLVQEISDNEKRRRKSYSGGDSESDIRNFEIFKKGKEKNKGHDIVGKGIFKNRLIGIEGFTDGKIVIFNIHATIPGYEYKDYRIGGSKFYTRSKGINPELTDIDDDFQDSGLGKVLYKAILRWCKDHDFYGIKSDPIKQVDRTKMLYKSLGGYIDENGMATLEAK